MSQSGQICTFFTTQIGFIMSQITQHKEYFPSLREYTMMHGLTKSILDSLPKEIVVMHPGPINRGVEISSDVADAKQSIILDQVENGVAIRMAVLYLLAGQQGA